MTEAAERRAEIERAFRRQGHFCGEMGSPLYADWLARCADDYAAGGRVARLVDGWQGHPVLDNVALRLTAAAHYYNNLGGEALLAGDNDRARALLETATRIAPDFVKAWNNLGVSFARADRFEDALATYQHGLGLEPDNQYLGGTAGG